MGGRIAPAGYRADIDGLRALAVLAVVWFHSALPGLSGGFAGVDVFFVISGYLITGIIAREQAAGTFSLRQFYERRVRRIAPALIAMLLAVLATGYALMLPEETEKLGQSALSVLGMVPNVYFWHEGNGGYFGLTKRISPPLLHTWSLGVEEQFYLLFPLLLLVARHRSSRARMLLALVAALSFALFLYDSHFANPAAFYLLPARAWELALGGLLALGAVTVPPRLHSAGSLVGLAAIIAGFALLGVDGSTPPWLLAAPVVGAAMLIASPNGAANRLLTAPPLVAVGRISYSLYLWHWPVFAFLRQWRVEQALPQVWALGGIALSFVLAGLSYRLIEQPARRPQVPFRRVLAAVLGGAAFAAAAALAMIVTGGFPARYSAKVLALAAQARDEVPHIGDCDGMALDQLAARCHIGSGAANAVLWGDSHAAADSEGLAAGLGRAVLLATMSGCPPELPQPSADPNRCNRRNSAVIAWLNAHPDIDTVMLVAHWVPPRKNKPLRWDGIQAAVAALPGKRVMIVAGVPEPGVNVPWAAALREARGMPPPTWSCPPARVLVSGAQVLDLSAAFCAHPRPWLLFSDTNHPSLTANREVIGPAVHQALAGR